MMINIVDKEKCCGCGACVQRCPKHCISMIEDEEGFLYPQVDLLSCIDCGLCEKVCPVIHQNEPQKPILVLAAKNCDNQKRLRSSSGGVFVALAEQTIKHGGIVFGARFDDEWMVKHCAVNNVMDLIPLMRSKYVQSYIGTSYKEAEIFLKQGIQVLFVGTPCQIAGLKKYLGKEYDGLLTVDVVCHGVPSPGIWKHYLKGFNPNRIVDINFRAKQNDGYEWKQYSLVIKGENGSVISSKWFREDIFLKGFLDNLFLRPSCSVCPAKAGRSDSDLTLADFWGIEDIESGFGDKIGVSSVFIHSEKGRLALKELGDIQTKIVTYEQAVMWNEGYYRSAIFGKQRIKFWKIFNETHDLAGSVTKVMYVSPIKVMCNHILDLISYNIHRIGRLIKRIQIK